MLFIAGRPRQRKGSANLHKLFHIGIIADHPFQRFGNF